MASPMSSASEGEILEPAQKANTASHNASESTVDQANSTFGLDGTSDMDDVRYGRRNISRSPSPYRRKPDRSPSPYRRKSDRSPSPYRRGRHDRSPSPFRHGRDGQGRGSNAPFSYKRKASPHRHERPEKRYNTDRDKHYSARENENRRDRRSSLHKDRENGASHNPSFRPSYAANDQNTAISKSSTIPTQSKSQYASRNGNGYRSSRSKTPDLGTDNKLPGAAPSAAEKHADVEMTSEADNEPDLTPAILQDVAPSNETREEKRRRWAAKRAQHAESNLLQKAVLTNASEATTPNIGSPAAPTSSVNSPPPLSPGLSDMDSMPASPDVMIIDKQEAANNGASPATNSPSASNYDPTQDMLDDRLRAEQRTQVSEMSASAYDETNPNALSTLPSEKAKPAKKKKKEIDMFAFSDDDDDDDEEEDGEGHDGLDAPTKGTVLDAKLLDNWDDPEGYYKIISNELVNSGRYRMIKGLGRGVFANVAQAEDVSGKSGELVAIKIIRKNDAMRKASSKEMDFLQRLNDADPHDKRHIIRLFGSFDHKGHLCIVFEHMSKNLRDLLKEETSGHGLSLQAVKTYARQMFSGLKHLQDCQIIHADLKPDNVLVSLDKKTVKLCDLGTAADKRDNNEPTPYLVSRFYRSPEIILGMDIGYGIDMWAIGCTIYELWTGKILFPGRSNNQMVKVIMECMGWPSEKLLKKGQLSGQHFEPGPPLTFISREVDQLGNPIIRKIEQHRMAPRPLKARIHDAGRGITGNGPSTADLNDFADLLTACLNWNFEKRIQSKDALAHKFFMNKTLMPRAAVAKPSLHKRPFTGGVRR
ncbi:kinase-like protein [Aaosphaeria arxii CBS 175.79]|uniref:non-specific serine/threonine protein kinase n=1 Tax=Aaosphaeria arxii CBS 175.79 TaxID=1450172 RepID=A0A6A5XUL8_9PLEO|nr:kinase-like protein [Aaosphaeria arxii CBS 175.79]KAF2016330.1 kinase-like protein [Aaosphaeria arxii CBS 175.79]